jgi:hypothetical protein
MCVDNHIWIYLIICIHVAFITYNQIWIGNDDNGQQFTLLMLTGAPLRQDSLSLYIYIYIYFYICIFVYTYVHIQYYIYICISLLGNDDNGQQFTLLMLTGAPLRQDSVFICVPVISLSTFSRYQDMHPHNL